MQWPDCGLDLSCFLVLCTLQVKWCLIVTSCVVDFGLYDVNLLPEPRESSPSQTRVWPVLETANHILVERATEDPDACYA